MSNVEMEIDEGVAWITFDDGKTNALSTDALNAINDYLSEAAGKNVPVVLKGRPGIFSAGFDLKILSRGLEERVQLLTSGIDLILAFLKHPNPIVSLCTGHAYPMGAFLLLSSDYRIGVNGNWNIGLNEVAIQMTVPSFALAVASHRLTRPGFARVGTAGMVNPSRAVEYGYLDEVVDETDLRAATLRVLANFHCLDMPSYVATKAAMNVSVIEQVEASKMMYG